MVDYQRANQVLSMRIVDWREFTGVECGWDCHGMMESRNGKIKHNISVKHVATNMLCRWSGFYICGMNDS